MNQRLDTHERMLTSRRTSRRGHSRTPRGKFLYAQCALALLVIGAPHFLGGVFGWGTLAISVLAWIALSALVIESHTNPLVSASEPFVGVLVALLCVTILHAIPLPMALASMIAPEAVANGLATAKGLDNETPGWFAFSLDPGNTYERILFGFALLASFCTARALSQARSSTQVLMTVAVSVVLLALSQLGHELLGAARVYGVYQPHMPGSNGPLINPNNRAGFMALGLPLCLGLSLREQSWKRAGWLMAAAVVGGTGLLADSRGGVAVLLAGPLLLITLHWARGRRDARAGKRDRGDDGSSMTAATLQVASMAIGLLVLAYGLARLANHEFRDTNYRDLSKIELFRAEFDMLSNVRHAMLGVGRGAFAPSFTTAYGGPGRALYAESLPLQYAVEFGVPLASLALLATLLRVRHRFWKWRTTAQLGAMAGLAAIGLQNLVDFSLELSGVAVPAAACFGACLPNVRWTQHGERWKSIFEVGRISQLTALFGLAILAMLGPRVARGDLLPAERQLRGHLEQRESEAFWALMIPVLNAHPAEASLASLAAAQLVTEREPRAGYWLNRAMLLAPGWDSPHIWAARYFRSLQRWDQALLELQLAAEAMPNDARAVLCEWLAERPYAAVALQAMPHRGPSRLLLLNASADCLGRAPAEAAKVDDVILREDPTSLPASLRRLRRMISAREWSRAVAMARALRATQPGAAQLYVLEAEAHRAADDPAQAVRVLTSAPDTVDDRRGILEALAFAQTAAGDEQGMRGTIEKLRLEAAGRADTLASVMLLRGRCEASLGNTAKAMKAIREAYTVSGGTSTLAEAAQFAVQLGQLDFALSVWRQLCNGSDPESYYCKQRDDLSKRLVVH